MYSCVHIYTHWLSINVCVYVCAYLHTLAQVTIATLKNIIHPMYIISHFMGKIIKIICMLTLCNKLVPIADMLRLEL